MILAPAKAGKSLVVLDLAVALATGQRWLGFNPCSEKVRTAIVSREDGAQRVKERLAALALGRGLTLEDLDQAGLLVNSEEQTTDFKIDNPQHVAEMAEWLKRNSVQMVFIDVLKNIHGADEHNAMRPVMAAFDELRRISGSQVCVLHHTNHGAQPGKARASGDTAISAWWDWMVSIEPDAEDEMIKSIFFRTKAGAPPAPQTVKYSQSEDRRASAIRPLRESRHSSVTSIVPEERQRRDWA